MSREKMQNDWEQNLRKHMAFNKKHSKIITYGTAGFRTLAEDLDHVMYRMGILAALRSMALECKIIGIMITASHNPECDNGVKLVDPFGEMMEQSWESIATSIANCENDDLNEEIKSIISKCNISTQNRPSVLIGRDTRASSFILAKAVTAGAKVFDAIIIDHEVVTTPMLHYYVHLKNSGSSATSLEDYYLSTLTDSFKYFRKEISSQGNYKPNLIFDGANGVGAVAMEKFMDKLGNSLNVKIFNNDIKTKGKLNYQCGSDFVKTNQSLPEGIHVVPGDRCVSVDGDADRLIYYYLDQSSAFHLLDGDRISALVAGYLMDIVQLCGINVNIGVVQTAYANGSSTKYISKQLNVPVACVPTGVKHLHHKALEFDIGVYFEANGHGTVVFSDKIRNQVSSFSSNSEIEMEAASKLKMFMSMINSTVGDAISDLLLVETVLFMKGWDVYDWTKLYTDLPNKLSKVFVKDRNTIVTKNPQGECSSPIGLQEEIDRLVSRYPSARAFVRASGTEDVIRVYAEAESQADVDGLSLEVATAVYNLAGGVGDPPKLISSL